MVAEDYRGHRDCAAAQSENLNGGEISAGGCTVKTLFFISFAVCNGISFSNEISNCKGNKLNTILTAIRFLAACVAYACVASLFN